LNKIARQLIVGDQVEVYGAAHKATKDKPLTINLEKIYVLALAQKVAFENPTCPKCNKRLKSMGKDQGFRCENCGEKYKTHKKMQVAVPRTLTLGLYVTSTRSQRHLTKPLRRYGQEKPCAPIRGMIREWHLL
jgi:tRNA(Ile2)-agmatinylcytidine synthase